MAILHGWLFHIDNTSHIIIGIQELDQVNECTNVPMSNESQRTWHDMTWHDMSVNLQIVISTFSFGTISDQTCNTNYMYEKSLE